MMSDSKLVDAEAGDYEDDERVVFRAEFDPATISYYGLRFFLVLLSTIFFLPLIIFYPCAMYGIRASFRARRLLITEKTIVYKRGFFGCCCLCWNEASKHVPLEKVTDITYSQGCLERQFGIASIQIQTAGQNGPDGRPELTIVGVRDAHNLRKLVMNVKAEHMARVFGGSTTMGVPVTGGKTSYGATDTGVAPSSEATAALVAVKDTLLRIEQNVQNIEQRLLVSQPSQPPAEPTM